MSASGRDSEEYVSGGLTAKFAPPELDWRVTEPDKATPARAIVVATVKPLAVLERLNAILSVGRWMDAFTLLPSGEVECRLSILVDGQWIGRTGIGGPPPSQPASAPITRYRPRHLDGLRAAALMFGVGYYLCQMPRIYADIDPATKAILSPPKLPAWAIPEAWQETGEAMARELDALLGQVSTSGKKPYGELVARLFVEHGLDVPMPIAKLPKKDTRAFIHTVNEWIKTIAAAQTKPGNSQKV